MPRMHHSDLQRLVMKAMRNGGERLSGLRYRWDISADCQNGYSRAVYAAPPAARRHIIDLGSVFPGAKPFEWSRHEGNYRGPITVDRTTQWPIELEIITRCRECDRCRRARTRLWRMRAEREIIEAERTWFGTLTLRPDAQYRFLLEARRVCGERRKEFDSLSEDEQYKLRVNAIYKELTKYLKRVRKSSGAFLRYCLVAERHKSGDPHFHVLIHEMDTSRPVRHAVLTEQWPFGFTNFKLVDDKKAAAYVAKYLSKSSLARVRASLHYGSNRS